MFEYADKLQLDRLVSHKYGFAEFDKTLQMVHDKKEKHKVMVTL